MTDPHDPLLQHIAKLRKQASPELSHDIRLWTPEDATLAQPAHEMSACVVALVRMIHEEEPECRCIPGEWNCPLHEALSAFAELAAAWGVEMPA